jgi:signal transduction histidine kinase
MKFKIIGSTHNTNIDERIFNASCFIGGFIGIFTVIINLFSNFPLFFDIYLSFTTLNFLILYFLSRFARKTKYLKIPFLINIILNISGAWFYNEGIAGSTSYFLSFAILGLPFIFNKNKNWVLATIILLALILIAIHFIYPETITPYPDYQSKLIDNAVSLIIMLIISAYTIMLFVNYLDKEHQTIELQKKEITEQAEELKTINNKLVELDKFKELMTGMVIHDLKNPLNSIIGLSNQNKPERNLKLIKQSSRQMLNLVMNILDVQKFDTTEIKLYKNKVKLHQLLKNVIDDISGIIEEKNIEIVIDGKTDYNILVDSSLIERVFVNILSNAIKYSDNNKKIIISIQNNNNEIKVMISDFGKGIEAENLNKVFDRFAQIENHKTGVLRSTGLGLAFCKMVINAHNNEIGVISEINNYTTFWFTLHKTSNIENTDNETIIDLLKKENLNLTQADKIYLESFIYEIKKCKYFEIGKLVPIINLIDENFSENIAIWKSEFENAVYANNEQTFNQLIEY